jgi:hypothetical protein
MSVCHAQTEVHEPEPKKEQPSSPSELRFFVLNITCITLAGVAISYWVLQYTDFFPLVGGFLGLTGVFAWVAFFTNLISKERKEELQKELERRYLVVPTTAIWVGLLLVVFILFAATRGTIAVVAPTDGAKHKVDVLADGKVVDTFMVNPGETARISLRVRPGRRIVTRTDGYPAVTVPVSSFSRITLLIPQSFTTDQPVLLVRLPAASTLSAKNHEVKVRIQHPRGNWEDYDTIKGSQYDGESIWIGCSADVVIDSNVRARWQTQDTGEPAVQYRWYHPKSAGADKPLKEGDVVRVCVSTEDKKGEMASGEATVLPRGQAFPQELILSASLKARCTE